MFHCRRPLRFPLVFLLAWAGLLAPCAAGRASEWPVYGADLGGTKHSPLRQIHTGNVGKLQPAWVYRCDDMRLSPASTIECNPLMIGGRLFITTAGLKVVSLDAATGVEQWVFDPWQGRGGRGVSRGLAHWAGGDGGDGARLFHVAGNTLYAVEARTGRLIPGFGNGGGVDLRDGLDRDVFFLSVTATSPGIVIGDLLILGSVVGEGPAPSAPGHIRAFDVRTGQRRWIFHTIPHPGEFGYETWSPDSWKTVGGVNSWGGLTVDAGRGLVFAGTGSASYDHFGGNRIGANLFANCVLALRVADGERVWHFQTVHHDLWDYDIPCPPNLVTVKHQGRRVDAVAQVTKLGHLFLLDRESGAPLLPVEERAVPPSEIPGEESWPTQPFPTRPPAFAQQRFSADEVTDLNPRARSAVLEQLSRMKTGDIFIPPGMKPSVVLPQFNGGGEWGGGAFDPESGLFYVNASNEAEWISMMPSRAAEAMTPAELGRRIYGAICSACHGVDRVNNPAAPSFASLKTVKERLTRAQVAELLVAGRNQMPSFRSLSDMEREAVTAFLFGDEGGARIPAERIQSSWADAIPFVATGHHDFRDPEGFPVNKRPWGTLNAIDLARGEIRWQVPLGTYPVLEKRGLPPTGTFNIGGPLVTRGGLVFIGASMDERFHAFDKRTGRLLWQYQLDAGGYATPCTYEVGGRQFVVIAAGGGGKPGTRPGNAFYAFSLPKGRGFER